jgi:hypothetical protein
MEIRQPRSLVPLEKNAGLRDDDRSAIVTPPTEIVKALRLLGALFL